MDDVTLRAAVPGDIPTLYGYENDPEALRRANFPARSLEAFTARWQGSVLGDPTSRARAVLVGGRLAGSVLAWWEDGRRFIGYWLAREFWGRGVGTAALRLFLAEEPQRPLYADTAVGNTASARLLERCGFRRVTSPDPALLLLVLDDHGGTRVRDDLDTQRDHGQDEHEQHPLGQAGEG